MIHTGKLGTDLISGILAIAAVSAIAGTLGHHAEASGTMGAPAGLSTKQQEVLDKAAGSSLFGQVRSSMADFLWLKADLYVHNGVEIRGQTDYEKKTNDVDQVHTAASDIAKGFKQHEGEAPVIPSAKRDWRGELGNIEREVQPYTDMTHHVHRNPKETLPLYRLMVASNPNFIPAYTTGAAMLALDKTKIDDAIAFLKEGETNNPRSIEIKQEIGYMFVAKKHDMAPAVPYLREAIAIAAQRDPQTMSDDELDAWEDSFAWLTIAYRYMGDTPNAHAVAIAGLKLFPTNASCRKQLVIEKNGEWRSYVNDAAYIASPH